MAKDRIGNELNVGDLVIATVSDPANQNNSIPLVARVTAIQGGGTIIPGGQNLRKHPQEVHVTLGIVSLSAEFQLAFDPTAGDHLMGVVKLVDPHPVKEGDKKGPVLTN